MNATKQFWTLVRFQFGLNPVMWFLPLIIGFSALAPFLITRGNTYYSSLSFYFFSNQNFFFVGIFGSTILAPDRFQFNRLKTNSGLSGTEFLLTRAVDRPIVYRAKVFLLYVLILLIPLFSASLALRAPELKIQESTKVRTQQVLDGIPGSTVAPTESRPYMQPPVTIPRGYFLIAEWQVWTFLLAIVLLQLLISLLGPFKRGGLVFWALVYLGLLGPAFFPLFQIRKNMEDLPGPMERLFYFFVEHQPAVWLGAALAVAACQYFCERRFTRQEQ